MAASRLPQTIAAVDRLVPGYLKPEYIDFREVVLSRSYITVVSGVPRSGTSLMMSMLAAGGLPILTDGIRKPDAQNPLGYFEYEPVKKLATNSAWLVEAQGKAVKIIYRLLLHLPNQFDYRVIFMERALTEVFDSQREMLKARGDAAADQDEQRMVRALAGDVRRVKDWLAVQSNMCVLDIPYAEVIGDPARWSSAIVEFLDSSLDAASMSHVVDADLYRQRRLP